MANYVYGKNSVKMVLETHPDRVFKVFVADGLKPDKRIDAIFDLAQRQGVAIQKAPRQKLDNMVDDPEAQHQGVLASVAPKKLLDISDLIAQCKPKIEAGQHPLVLMLDGVTDPRNFGAILRVADAAGVEAVVVPKQHSAGFGPAVAKTASGAEETVDVAVVPNLVQAMEKLQQAGFWSVGAALAPTAKPYYEQDYKMPTVLIVGSEGQGLGRLVQEKCDFLVKIPMHGTVESLNVATATAILVFEVVKASFKRA